MKILAIETSCDDTCAAVVEGNRLKKTFKILSNIVSSQEKIHKKWGGVYPSLAKREHQKNLVVVLKKALTKSKLLFSFKQKIEKEKNRKLEKILERDEVLRKKTIEFLKNYKKPKIDAVSVTVGPGLDPSLWTGVNFAKALSFYWNIPIIPVNHLEGHIFSSFLDKKKEFSFILENSSKLFPAVSLIASGGHTQLVLIKKIGDYKVIGETRDDAAGECFDKTARILGLGYPGGPIISQKADEYQKNKKNDFFVVDLPRPMINQKNYDFSFSGLKTAVLYRYRKEKKRANNKNYIFKMCFEIQEAIIDVLTEKAARAAKEYNAKSLILGGGVSANKELRKTITEKMKKNRQEIPIFFPSLEFCTDNAAMIGLVSFLIQNMKKWHNIKAIPNLRL